MEILYISIIVAFDQISKYFVRLKLMPIGNFDLINGYLSLNYVENRGAAFGKFQNETWILIGVNSIVILFMIYYLLKNKNMGKWMKISFILIIAGALGNLIDRVYLGYVVNFLWLFKSHNLPVFNFADMSVVSGTVILCVDQLFAKK